MHFQYTVFGPLDEFHGFIQICYYECPHISGIYLESLLIAILCNHFTFYIGGSARVVSDFSQTFSVCVLSHKNM